MTWKTRRRDIDIRAEKTRVLNAICAPSICERLVAAFCSLSLSLFPHSVNRSTLVVPPVSSESRDKVALTQGLPKSATGPIYMKE